MESMTGESKRPSPPCELYEVSERPSLRSANGVNIFRSWRCSCGGIGSGYRFDNTTDVYREWADHAAKGSSR